MEEATSRARLRVSLQAGEVDVEGSEAFVGRYAQLFEELVSRLKTVAPAELRHDSDGRQDPQPGGTAVAEFPEALHQFSSKSGTDQILLAGAFAGMRRGDGTFSTGEANALLVEQGIKLANASQSMTNNLKAKRVFKSGKNWKVSRTGEEYLRWLGVNLGR